MLQVLLARTFQTRVMATCFPNSKTGLPVAGGSGGQMRG
jgi:hypothetical protein